MSALRTVATAALALAASAGPAVALDLVGGGFAAPLFLTAPAGDPRLFVVEKAGVIKVRSAGTWTPFLDINSLVDIGGERGLLGLAFDPNFASNRFFYVLYSDKTTNHDSIVARYQASAANPNIADPLSAQPILTIPQSSSSQIHRGGWIGLPAGRSEQPLHREWRRRGGAVRAGARFAARQDPARGHPQRRLPR